MARTRGARNADYEESRLALARQVRTALLEDDGLRSSLRELAASAGTSVATLKHYFGNREGIIVAVMESLRIDGAPYIAQVSSPTSGDLRASLTFVLKRLTTAWVKYRVGDMHAAMLAEGLSRKQLGPSYVTLMLEPLLQLGEQVLQRHVDAKELTPCDVRHASLALLSPLVMALLHQENLSGAGCRPLDVNALIGAHVEAFLRAFPPLRKRAPARA